MNARARLALDILSARHANVLSAGLMTLALLGSAACIAEAPPVTPPPDPIVNPPVNPPPGPGENTFDDHWNPAQPNDRGPKDLFPSVEVDGKAAQRMSVPQLRSSIPALFNGLIWDNGNRTAPQNMFNVLSRTLGEPDYLQNNEENRDSTPLFHKFMDDMAGQVCAKAVTADQAQTDTTRRAVIPYDTDIDRNLRFLRLKLHGIYVPDASMDGLAELRQLYDNVLADTSNAGQAWTGVCVAMLTAPEFMAY